MPINSFLYPAKNVPVVYEVANSCRFNVGSNDFLSRTIGTPTDEDRWTFSVWLKITGEAPSVQYGILSAGNYPNAYETIHLNGSDQLFYHYNDGGGADHGATKYAGIIRDPSAWYNLIVSRNGTAGKIYINGTDVTTTVGAFNNSTNVINKSGGTLRVGHSERETSGRSWNGYMSEVVFCDGQLLDQTSFGEFDSDSGIWKPIDVSGLTFGDNGFYLDFEDSSALGNDVSGNNNDFTASNLTAIDQATDTPTNNFATLNPLYNAYVDPTFSEGNLKITQSSGWSGAKATMGVSTGKWYWEVKLTGTMSSHIHGVQQENVNEGAQNPQNTTGTTSFYNHDGGEVNTDGSNTTADYGTLDDGDILGIALDMDAGSYGQITFYDNGSAIASNINLSSSSTTVMPHFSIDNSTVECNFGSPPYSISSGNADGNGYGNFEYSVPSGYYSLCTKNLAEFG